MDKKPGVAVLIAEKVELKTKGMTRDKEEHFIMIQEFIKKTEQNKIYTYI